MEVLFYRYNSICEPDIIAILRRLGHAVSEITEEMTNKSIGAKAQMDLVAQALKKKPCQAVFSINFFPIVSEVCNIFHIPYVCWVVDCPVMELYSHSIRNPWNRIFLFDYAMYEEFTRRIRKAFFTFRWGRTTAAWIPCWRMPQRQTGRNIPLTFLLSALYIRRSAPITA